MQQFLIINLNRKLLPNDADLLTEETIDTFGNMCLSPSTHSQICQKIIRYIKTNAPNDVNIFLCIVFIQFEFNFNLSLISTVAAMFHKIHSEIQH